MTAAGESVRICYFGTRATRLTRRTLLCSRRHGPMISCQYFNSHSIGHQAYHALRSHGLHVECHAEHSLYGSHTATAFCQWYQASCGFVMLIPEGKSIVWRCDAVLNAVITLKPPPDHLKGYRAYSAPDHVVVLRQQLHETVRVDHRRSTAFRGGLARKAVARGDRTFGDQ